MKTFKEFLQLKESFKNQDGSFKALDQLTDEEKDKWMKKVKRNRKLEPSDETIEDNKQKQLDKKRG